MSRCSYCGSRDGRLGHEPNCPHNKPPDSPEKTEWQRGWDDGRGNIRPSSDSELYMMGWLRGDVALDEAMESVLWSS